MLAQRSQHHPVAHQCLRRVGDEDLTAVRERHQPCCPVHVAAEVAPLALDRLTGMKSHAHRELDIGVVTQLLLGLDGRSGGVGGGRERGAEAVAGGREDVAAVSFDGAADDGIVDPQRVGHVSWGVLPQTAGVLDIGEQEGHRAPGGLERHGRTVTRGPHPATEGRGDERTRRCGSRLPPRHNSGWVGYARPSSRAVVGDRVENDHRSSTAKAVLAAAPYTMCTDRSWARVLVSYFQIGWYTLANGSTT